MEGFETGRRGEVGCWLHDCLWNLVGLMGLGCVISLELPMSAHVKDCEDGRTRVGVIAHSGSREHQVA